MRRKLPYPYRGCLSISNDIEFFDFNFFETLMSFFNSDKQTALGKGLNLEITSSLFFYTVNHHTFSYFEGSKYNANLSQQASRLNNYLKNAWIDANHAYGDFDGVGGFTRDHALRCYEQLDKLGVNLPIFTNHGGIENIQNVGNDAEYHYGDLVDNSAYHADLMQEHGVDFIWTDSLIIVKDLTKNMTKKQLIKHRLKQFFTRQMEVVPENQNILIPITLQNQMQFSGFYRFRSTGVNAPNFSSLAYQLKQIDWETLYKNYGTIILYQHLGVLYRVNAQCQPANFEALLERPEVYLSPFYWLKNESEKGDLWVGGLAKVLNYIAMSQTVKIERQANQQEFHLFYPRPVANPQQFFQGLTLYIDPALPASIFYQDNKLNILYNGPDETGRYSVMLPLQKLEAIW